MIWVKKKSPGRPGDQQGTRHDSPSVSRVDDAVYLGETNLRPSALCSRSSVVCNSIHIHAQVKKMAYILVVVLNLHINNVKEICYHDVIYQNKHKIWD